jgi:hypothetical protein
MARPRLENPAVRIDITLSLRPGEDNDLIAWFEAIPPRLRAQAVIARLRTGEGGAVAGDSAVNESVVTDMLSSMMFR